MLRDSKKSRLFRGSMLIDFKTAQQEINSLANEFGANLTCQNCTRGINEIGFHDLLVVYFHYTHNVVDITVRLGSISLGIQKSLFDSYLLELRNKLTSFYQSEIQNNG